MKTLDNMEAYPFKAIFKARFIKANRPAREKSQKTAMLTGCCDDWPWTNKTEQYIVQNYFKKIKMFCKELTCILFRLPVWKSTKNYYVCVCGCVKLNFYITNQKQIFCVIVFVII